MFNYAWRRVDVRVRVRVVGEELVAFHSSYILDFMKFARTRRSRSVAHANSHAGAARDGSNLTCPLSLRRPYLPKWPWTLSHAPLRLSFESACAFGVRVAVLVRCCTRRSHVRSELGPARREVVVSVKDARSRPGDAAGRAR